MSRMLNTDGSSSFHCPVCGGRYVEDEATDLQVCDTCDFDVYPEPVPTDWEIEEANVDHDPVDTDPWIDAASREWNSPDRILPSGRTVREFMDEVRPMTEAIGRGTYEEEEVVSKCKISTGRDPQAILDCGCWDCTMVSESPFFDGFMDAMGEEECPDPADEWTVGRHVRLAIPTSRDDAELKRYGVIVGPLVDDVVAPFVRVCWPDYSQTDEPVGFLDFVPTEYDCGCPECEPLIDSFSYTVGKAEGPCFDGCMDDCCRDGWSPEARASFERDAPMA